VNKWGENIKQNKLVISHNMTGGNNSENYYKGKYLFYKNKYLMLKNIMLKNIIKKTE